MVYQIDKYLYILGSKNKQGEVKIEIYTVD